MTARTLRELIEEMDGLLRAVEDGFETCGSIRDRAILLLDEAHRRGAIMGKRHFYVRQDHGATLVLAGSREEVVEILKMRNRRLYPTAISGKDYEETVLDDVIPIPNIGGFQFYDMD